MKRHQGFVRSKKSRRQFLGLTLGVLGGSAAAVANHYWPLKNQINRTRCLLNTSEPETPDLRFVVFGDFGFGMPGQYKVARALERHHQRIPFNLALLAGDNIYNNGEIEKVETAFERPYRQLLEQNIVFRAVLGNHDVRTRNGVDQIAYKNFNMLGRYYTFTEGPAQFFMLDSNEGEHWQAQLSWLQQQLSQSTQPWKIVCGHHPVYSSGKHGNSQKLIQDFQPLFQEFGVQLYCSGHDHSYERSQPIDGTTYLVAGAAAKLRPVGKSEWTAHSTSELSFASIEINKDELTIHGVNHNNCVMDQGSIYL